MEVGEVTARGRLATGVRRCEFCQGYGIILHVESKGGALFFTHKTACWSCFGTGYPHDSLTTHHVALDQALATIEDQIEGMAEDALAHIDEMVAAGNRRQAIKLAVIDLEASADAAAKSLTEFMLAMGQPSKRRGK